MVQFQGETDFDVGRPASQLQGRADFGGGGGFEGPLRVVMECLGDGNDVGVHLRLIVGRHALMSLENHHPLIS